MKDQIVNELSKDLTDRYDFISKLDAILYLKSIHGNLDIKYCLAAWHLAYN